MICKNIQQIPTTSTEAEYSIMPEYLTDTTSTEAHNDGPDCSTDTSCTEAQNDRRE